MQTYYQTIDGEQISVTLHSLDEYEANGGEYDDAGNGGEDMSSERGQFLCAATIGHETGYPDNDVLEMAGCTDYWYDSVTDYFLLREWPTSAPLEARCGVGE